MKLDRNINPDGTGRYALVDIRKLGKLIAEGKIPQNEARVINDTFIVLEEGGAMHFGAVDSEYEFFPVVLKDINAEAALTAYANSAESHDLEFANEVREMARRAGPNHPDCKIPD